MKKILSLILAGLMSISCAAFVAADDAAAEVAADPYQDYAIEFLSNYGIFKGGEGLTNEDLIQRYQMALFVARVSTGWVDDYKWDYNYDWEDNTANNSTFDDLAGTPAESYYGAISYANQKGIIEGYSATKFGPTDGITYRDALTMVCRTLGYKGLSYPWGYIETAVELGLTKGIDAVYTEELTRGEVAVIIYNAMFVPTKSGETLAKSIFDVDFGWKNIVIVSTDEGGFHQDVDARRAATGYVGFKVLDDAGMPAGKTYYVPSSELGLTGHEEEIELGSIYVALFEVDGDLVDLVDADSLNFATVVNNGITDNEGAAYGTLPIAAAIAPYKNPVDDSDYLAFLGNYLYVYTTGTYEFTAENNTLVAIDFDTMDILKRTSPTSNDWTIAWYYNETLDRYYRYEWSEDHQYGGTNGVYVDWMSDEEFAAWYANAIKYVAGTETQYVLTGLGSIGNNPYAKLRMFDIDADGLAEIASYKDYQIGIFSNTTLKCTANVNNVNHSAGVNMPAYSISALDAEEGTYFTWFVEAGHEAHDINAEGYLWMNVADDVIGFANEDGTYNNGVVLFNRNITTGEVEIVKYIPENAEGTDADSYIFTGILQGYSTRNATITVDGEKYAYGYDTLRGVDPNMVKGNLNIAARSIVAYELDQYLMQYVKVLVVDGLVVDVDALNAASNKVLVVLDYAGITSDGYIAVYAYDTASAKLGVYKINSFNGWKEGDYRYYPLNAKEDKAFEAGCVYTINSYDPETDSYGVYTTTIDELYAGAAATTIEVELGYKTINGATTKASASDRYVMIDEAGIPYVVVAPAAGKVTGLWNSALNVMFLNDNSEITGDFVNSAYEVNYVLYDGNSRVLEAAYDDAQDVEGYYLLGSTVSEVVVFNLTTGKHEYVFVSTNIDLVEGAIYMTIGETVVRCYAANFADFKASATLNSTLAEHVYELEADLEAPLTKREVAALYGLLPATTNETILNDVANSAIDEILYYNVMDGSFAPIVIDEAKEYDAFMIYNEVTKDVIVYVEYFDNDHQD